jgi:hypothetical protein
MERESSLVHSVLRKHDSPSTLVLEVHLYRFTKNQIRLHYIANRLMLFMEKNRLLFSESYESYMYIRWVHVVATKCTLISSLVNRTFGEKVVAMQI